MKQEEPNPYAPPPPIVEQEQASTLADEIGSLATAEFSGCVTHRELDEYLRADGHVGCARLVLLGLGFGSILLALPVMGLAYFAVVFGAMGIVAIILMVSTLPYRRTMFINLNPNWSDPVLGRVGSDGVHVERGGSVSYYHWNWFGEAIASDGLVAFMPATQAAIPLLLSREMFSTVEGWESLQRVANAIGTFSNDVELEDIRRDRIFAVLKDDQRAWAFPPPEGSIVFEGMVSSDDYELLPRRYRDRQRPLRTHLVIYGLVGFAGLILGGCSGVIFRHYAVLPVIFAVYLFSAIAIGRRRQQKSRSIIYYLRGYAGETSVVTDFGLSIGETKWDGLDLVSNSDSSIVLRRRSLKNFIVVRPNMFASSEEWARFLQLITDRFDSVAHPA